MTQPSPLEQIDQLLSAWDERLRRMDENLVALESEAIYQILAGKAGKRPALEGVTKERVGPALDAVTELFENRERLSVIVEQAKSVRATISPLTFWGNDDKMAEIVKLLRGSSIELGQKVVALSERNLLDQGYHDVLVAPEELLAQMVTRFEEARTTLLAVSCAWESLDTEMTRIEATMTALRQRAAELHPPPRGPFVGEKPKELAELAEAEGVLAALRGRVAKDPLGAAGGVAHEITPRLTALRQRLEAEAAARGRVQAALAEARLLGQRLREENARAVRFGEEARRDLYGPAVARLPPALEEGALAGLDEWLRKLEGTVEAGRWSPAEVGLLRFREAARQELGAAEAAAHAAEALLAKRGELAGLLSARRAQATAFAARGMALGPSAEGWAKEAEALLKRRPVPIDELTHAVEAYEAAVVALGRR